MRGFKVFAVGLSAIVALTFAACDEKPTEPENQVAGELQASLGNGYPSPHFDYKLNIIGVPQEKSADMDNNNGRRIFVMLNSVNTIPDHKKGGKNNQLAGSDVNKIYLCNSTNGENDYNKDGRCDAWRTDNVDGFGVIDANATDSNGALFGIPDPCAGEDSTDGCTPRYAIWARAKTPGGNAIITTCAEEEYTGDDNDIWCGDNGVTLTKRSDRQAIEVTQNLLFMGLTIDGTEDDLQNCIEDTTDVDYGENDYDIYLFDRCFENYFWNYDNNGLKNLELRFYWEPTV